MPTRFTIWLLGCVALVAMLCSSTLVAVAACTRECPDMQSSCCPLGEEQKAADDESLSTDEGKWNAAPSDCCEEGALFFAAPRLHEQSFETAPALRIEAESRDLLDGETARRSMRDPALRGPAPPTRVVPVPTARIVLLR